jgi:S-adenosylmethionine uptake transporter
MKLNKSDIVEQNNIYGILFMIINALAVSIIYVVAKSLSQDISSNLMVFLYKFTILLCIIPWIIKEGISSLKTNRIHLHALRGFLSISGSLSLYYAIKHIELADITAVGYLEQVILVIVGIIYFGEKSTIAKIIGISASFLGALIVVYPDIIDFGRIGAGQNITDPFESINPYYSFVFLSIFFWATNCTVVKILGKTEKTKVQLFYVLLFSSIIAFPMAFMNWTETTFGPIHFSYPSTYTPFNDLGLEIGHIKYLAVLALCYFTHSVSFFKALKHAELSTVIPFDYSRLLFAGIFGYIFFGEVPEYGSYFGYILIIFAGVFLVKAERRRKKLQEQQIAQLESEYEHS